jgi:general secretion pathway protein A
MYCEFFGLSEKPFDVTPDPKFLYLTPGHKEALSSLIYGIRERRGFIVLVGEVGTGKTTLLNAVVNRLDEKTQVSFVFNTDVAFEEMLNMALVDLGLAKPASHLRKVEALERLNDFAIRELARGSNVTLIVDEAQNLDWECLENIRLLSNLETRKHKLIQIVLSGQPELDRKLNQPELRQLAQRVSVRRYISPLGREDTYRYIRHRLKVAGHRGFPLFDQKAYQLIWRFSGGVPRKINMVCDNALLLGYALRKKTIKTAQIEEAIKDLSSSPFSSPREPDRTPSVQDMALASPQLRQQQAIRRSRIGRTVMWGVAMCGVLVVGLLVGRFGLRVSDTVSIPILPSIRSEEPSPTDSLDGSSQPSNPVESVDSSPLPASKEPVMIAAATPSEESGGLGISIEGSKGIQQVEEETPSLEEMPAVGARVERLPDPEPARALEGVSVTTRDEITQVTITADGVIKGYDVFALRSPARLVIDLWKLKNLFSPQAVDRRTPHIDRIRIGEHPNKIRLVLDSSVAELPPYRINRIENELVVLFGDFETTTTN